MSGGTKDVNSLCTDYITNLPDGVMSEILSKIPLKEAVRTSVLSKHWESKWTLTYNVSIDSKKIFPRGNKNALVALVNKILFHVSPIRSFQLTCSCCGDPEFNTVLAWVFSVLKPKLESLEINVWCDCRSHNPNHQLAVLPSNCLIGDSLKNLVLKMSYKVVLSVEVALSECFANLTRLCLENIRIINVQSNTGTLVFTLPVITEFKLVDCELSRVMLVEIHAPLLTVFKFVTPESSAIDEYSIKIVGANLEKIFLSGEFPVNTILDRSTVADASLVFRHYSMDNAEEKYAAHVLKMLKALSNVKMLEISGELWGIVRARPTVALIWLPELERLHISLPTYGEVLLELLHAAPFLKSLRLYLPSGNDDYDYGDYEDYDYDEADEYVPYCLTHCLEEIILHYGSGEEPEFDVVEFLFKNGLQLKNVSVHGSSLLMNYIMDELSKLPTGATNLVIKRV